MTLSAATVGIRGRHCLAQRGSAMLIWAATNEHAFRGLISSFLRPAGGHQGRSVFHAWDRDRALRQGASWLLARPQMQAALRSDAHSDALGRVRLCGRIVCWSNVIRSGCSWVV